MRAAPPTVLAAIVALAAQAGCDGAPKAYIDIALVTPAGESPLENVDTLTVTVRQGIDEPIVQTTPVTADGFQLDLELVDFTRRVDIAVALTGPTTRLVGGPPQLLPTETGTAGEQSGLVVVAVGPSHTCGVVSGMTFDVPRAHAAVSRQGTYALVLGGEGMLGVTDAVSFLDLIRLGVPVADDPDTPEDESSRRLDDLSSPLGDAASHPIDLARTLIVSASQPPFVYDITGSCPDGGSPVCAEQPAPVGLHAAAGPSSAIVSLRDGGAVVAGGDLAGAPTDEISWIDSDGRVARRHLATPRTGAVAVELAGDGARVLVVGGEADGAPFAELIVRSADGVPVADARADAVRTGGVLFSDGADGALLAGGVDGAGVPRDDTVRLAACSTRCTVAAGPTHARARLGAAAALRATGGGLFLGGAGPVALVDEVRFDPDGTAHVEPHGDLEVPRADASAFALPNGLVFVVGGRGPTGPLGDVEVCFPEDVALP